MPPQDTLSDDHTKRAAEILARLQELGNATAAHAGLDPDRASAVIDVRDRTITFTRQREPSGHQAARDTRFQAAQRSAIERLHALMHTGRPGPWRIVPTVTARIDRGAALAHIALEVQDFGLLTIGRHPLTRNESWQYPKLLVQHFEAGRDLPARLGATLHLRDTMIPVDYGQVIYHVTTGDDALHRVPAGTPDEAARIVAEHVGLQAIVEGKGKRKLVIRKIELSDTSLLDIGRRARKMPGAASHLLSRVTFTTPDTTTPQHV